MPRKKRNFLYLAVIFTFSLLAGLFLICNFFSLATAHSAAPADSPKLILKSCKLPGLDEEVHCGRYEVWENRAIQSGRKISLKVVVLPALTANHLPDPLVYFAGGPGDSAINYAPYLSHSYQGLRHQRDIVLIDVRGTGDSHPLFCDNMRANTGVQSFLDDFLPVNEVKACLPQHQASNDLTQYTTAAAVDDVDEILTVLGYSQVNLMGASYGTRASLEFIRRHPDRVRSAVLMGVVPPDARIPLTFARDAQHALDSLFTECDQDEDCHKAFPDIRDEFTRVLTALEKNPVQVEVPDTSTGSPLKITLTRNGFAQTIRYMLYAPVTAAMVPLYIHSASSGDFKPMAQIAFLLANQMTQMSDGYYLCTTCAEDVAWIQPDEIAKAVEGTFLGDFRIRKQIAACAAWLYATVSSDVLKPVSAKTPVLLISGERDPVTPAQFGEEVAKYLPNSRHIIVPDGGHDTEGLKNAECLTIITENFIKAGSVGNLDVSAVTKIERPPFVMTKAPSEIISLSDEELKRFVGTYVAKGGFSIAIDMTNGKLRSALPDNTAFLLSPVSKTHFLIDGLPVGYDISFKIENDRVIGLIMGQGAETKMEMTKK